MSMAKSTAIPLISRGLPAVVVGVFSLAWSGVTVSAIAGAFARYALVAVAVAVGVDVMRAFNGDRVGPVAGYLLLAALSLAAAFGSLTWPGAGAATLASVFGVYSILHGTFVPVVSARIRRATHTPRRLARSH
ncbi:hypothetical protein ABZ153_20725 [Streptomyces sp. NPDC006290]|uniref:hypothetical protein n=1 Tax=Streptomyces sp. NPDC006290 TaxID=3156745 RepID=UPI0033A391CE